MKKTQAYKFRLKAKPKQALQLRRYAGSSRYVYNCALALQKERFEKGEKKLTYAQLCQELTSWKQAKETAWLNDSPSQSLQQSLKDLERAYQNFFAKRTKFPKFKKRGVKDTFRYPQGCKLDQSNSRIFLPKLGWIKYFNSQEVLGKIKNVTVSYRANNWYVSIQTEREISVPFHEKSNIIGIDVGIAKFAVLSDRKEYPTSPQLKQKWQRLKYQQRQLSKKAKFSKNWQKQKRKLARMHHKVSNVRLDYLHKISDEISKNHAMIILEDLQIKNMSKSASGTIDAPGKNVKAKSGLNRALLDQGLSEFRRQLIYKAKWSGGDVIMVDPKYTSQTCPSCKYVSKDNRKTQSIFDCVKCGFKDNADYVGALNILAAGHAVLACGEMVRLGHSVKQEPACRATKVA